MKKNLQNRVAYAFWNEFVYGGHLLSFGGMGIVLTVLILLEQPTAWPLLALSYLIPQIIYSYNHLKELRFDETTNPERAFHINKIKHFLPILIALKAMLLVGILFFSSNISLSIFTIFLVAGGILFTEYFKDLTKYLIGFKNIYTAIFWALIVFLPAFYYTLPITPFFLLVVAFTFLRWVINAVFFDFKDVESDQKRKLKTLPVSIGTNNTLLLLHLLNAVSLIPVLLGAYLEILPTVALLLCVFFLYSFFYLMKVHTVDKRTLRALSYVMVDAEYIFWPIIILLGAILLNL